jgi:AcrR family transcriptional regulator
MGNPITDRRRQRGDRTRRTVAVRAAERASIEGLDGLSLGRLAADLRISKGGIQAAYPTKEELQLAAVAAATEIFVREVVTPVGEPRGLRRLWALVEAWLAYVDHRVLPGGCFMAATVPEFDSRPGAVRDALTEARSSWLGLLEQEIRYAQDQRELADEVPANLLAFEVDALLTMANNACNLADRPAPLDAARALLILRVGPDPRKTRRRAVHPRRSRSSSPRTKGAER